MNYVHLPTAHDGDLYVTWDSVHRLDHLLVENWLAPAWFEAKRERLPGTSTVYRLPTKPVNGHSIDLVVKYCRVGQDVPLDTMTFNRFANAEFNSPYDGGCAPPNPAPLAAAGVRGELRINATKWQTNEKQNTQEPAELQL